MRAAIRTGGSSLLLSKLSDCFSHNRLDGGERQQLGQLYVPRIAILGRFTGNPTRLFNCRRVTMYASAELLAGSDITKCVAGSNNVLFPDN